MTLLHLLAALALGDAPASPEPLLLPHVLQSVQQHLPLVLAAHEDARAARARVTGAQGGFDPVVRGRGSVTPFGDYPAYTVDGWVEQPTPILGSSMYAGWRLGQGAFAAYDGKLATGNLGELRGGVRVPLGRHLMMDPRRAALERANLDTRVQDASVGAALLDGGTAAGNAWLNWLAAGRRLTVQQQLLDLAETRQQALVQRAAAGDLAPVEVDENRRAVLARHALVVQAQRVLEQAALQLSLYARTPLGAPRVPAAQELPGDFPPTRALPSEVESVALAVDRRPELVRQRNLEQQARVETRLAEQDLLPTVDLWLQASQDLATASPYRHRPEVAGVLTVDVPLPARAARGRVEAQEAAARKVRHQTRWVEERIQADVKDVLSAWTAGVERVTLAQAEVDVAQRLAQGELRRFDVGEGTLLLVNLREQAAAEAALRLLDAQLDVSRAQLAWMGTTGQLFR